MSRVYLSNTFTEANLSDPSIIIDNTAPTIVLVGNNNTIVPTNSSYTDLGATASDLSYAADIPVTGTSNIDTTQSGNYTFTYTAPDDEAGNPGPIITRNVIVADTPPIGITTLTIATASGTLYAKAGDTVYLTLEVNDTISTHNIQILNASVTSISPNDNALRLQAQVSDNATESNAEFTITITNPNGTTLTVTEDDLTSSNVFIDTISPRIQLIGSSANYSIINGTDPIILNVTVTDGDPNYSGIFTLVPNATVNADINGSVYNYTYTADADNAGNLGESVSRIITIIDADPITVTSLSIASSPGNPNFANADKTITVTLETDGTDLGNFTVTLLGRDIAKADVTSGTATFTTTVLPGDINENVTFSITATNSSENRILVTNEDITDGSFVTIDTIKPVIELVGASFVSVLQGNPYSDLGTTITDQNNPSYTGTASATSVDTSSLAHIIINYTGPADAAGNVPDPISRSVLVLAKPLGIVTLTCREQQSGKHRVCKN